MLELQCWDVIRRFTETKYISVKENPIDGQNYTFLCFVKWTSLEKKNESPQSINFFQPISVHLID